MFTLIYNRFTAINNNICKLYDSVNTNVYLVCSDKYVYYKFHLAVRYYFIPPFIGVFPDTIFNKIITKTGKFKF